MLAIVIKTKKAVSGDTGCRTFRNPSFLLGKRMCFYSLSNSIYLNTRGPIFSMAGDFIQVHDQNSSDLSKKVV